MRSSDLDKRSDLVADQVVCLVKTGLTKEAAPLYAKLPEPLKSRADVAAAARLLPPASSTTQTTSKPSPLSNTPTAIAPATTRNARTQTAIPAMLIRTRQLVQQGKFAEAATQLRVAVAADPRNRAYRLALLEAAVLAKDWATANAQLSSVTPLTAGEELYMFYGSVALFETGRAQEAKSLMEKAKDRMNSSPLVDHYLNAVLGSD
jgi:thioredoxin-like negative regulator of GroEL